MKGSRNVNSKINSNLFRNLLHCCLCQISYIGSIFCQFVLIIKNIFLKLIITLWSEQQCCSEVARLHKAEILVFLRSFSGCQVSIYAFLGMAMHLAYINIEHRAESDGDKRHNDR